MENAGQMREVCNFGEYQHWTVKRRHLLTPDADTEFGDGGLLDRL
jgi:hypothetical protein